MKSLAQRLRAVYYLVAFGRSFPGSAALAKMVTSWELTQGKGDSPKPAAMWDAQYASGEWAYMGRETPRYQAVCAQLKGTVLDVGCGDGLLYESCRSLVPRYIGIDVSAEAVAQILRRHPDAECAQADAEAYQPPGPVDTVVFNETLYYFNDPIAAIRRALTWLAPGGRVVVSLYTASRRSRVIAKRLDATFKVSSRATTKQGDQTWICLVIDG